MIGSAPQAAPPETVPAQSAELAIDSTVVLNNGVAMPRLGLGVWQARRGEETRRAVLAALESGYRLIDTAAAYGNEHDVGRAVRESGLARADVFVTTKLWNADQGYDSTLRALDRSIEELGLGPVDLYLMHWPVPRLRRASWRAMEQVLQDGRCRAIGVSNFTVRHLEELLDACATVPAVNQVEFHPFLYQEELLDFCRGQGVQLEAYSPLARARRLRDRGVVEVARRHGKTPAQVLIRWGLQHGLVVIPKSTRRERIAENADVFDFALSPDEMRTLDALDEGLHTCWDPTGGP